MPQFVIADLIRNPDHLTAWMPDRVWHDKGTFVISNSLRLNSSHRTPDHDLQIPMTEEQLLARDAGRDIGAERLLSVRQMTASNGKVVIQAEVPAANVACTKSELSQEKLAHRVGFVK